VTEPDWLKANRANWDERVAIHLGPRGYDISHLKAGNGRLFPIEEAELGSVAGLRVAHLQCHFGADSLTLAQRGARVVGLDFSPPAIAAARRLSAELGLESRARFVEANVYDAPAAIGEDGFDLVFATWGTICWLPDVAAWAAVVASLLRPGGRIYFADGHPVALVYHDLKKGADGMPGWLVPYCARAAYVAHDARDYADPTARLTQTLTHQWIHPLGEVVTALIRAGLRLGFLAEHDRVPWRMFECLEEGPDRLWRWPAEPWLPLAFSLSAERPTD
jgi:SAM-dependent methyltransferase